MKPVSYQRLAQIVGTGGMWCGHPEIRAMAEELIQLRRLRLAFEGYIRDRSHRVDLIDEEVQEVIEEWLAVAQDVEDVK